MQPIDTLMDRRGSSSSHRPSSSNSTRMEVDVDGSFSYAEPQTDAKASADEHSRPKEEQLLRAFYEFKIQDVCDAFKFPRKIQATALIYFKRFYLQWSVMEHHPKNIMLTCIYAACKAEENHVSAEELGKGIEQDHHMILDGSSGMNVKHVTFLAGARNVSTDQRRVRMKCHDM